ncbi:MAG: sigma-70 family RNA polymerase sigma factor [Myxococcaceae bacterium]|nr:sigma-70 family RNA polymerase sigma factor [Myxococcaceae bacterium]
MQAERDQLARISAGDAAAFGQWASSVESSLRQTLRPFATLCDTEAVLQEALLRVWQVAPRFVHDGRPNALLRFAVTTTRNVALSELRKTNPTPTEVEALHRALDAQGEVQPLAPDPKLRAAISKCREKLPPQPGQALAKRLEGTGDDHALAAALRMSLNTFLQNVTRARKFLAECLKKAGVDLDLELSP